VNKNPPSLMKEVATKGWRAYGDVQYMWPGIEGHYRFLPVLWL
jgi:hypothetical protein